MNVLKTILGSCNVVVVKYCDAISYDVSLIKVAYKNNRVEIINNTTVDNLSDHKNDLRSNVVILCVCGYGVISKERSTSTEIVSKVMADGEKFLYSLSDNDRFMFVRKDQLSAVIGDLESMSAKTADIICIDAENIEEAVVEKVKTFYIDRVTLRSIIKPTEESSVLATIVGHKLRLPVLVFLLLALVANFITGSDVRTKYQQNHASLAELQHGRQEIGDKENLRRQIVSEYENGLPWRFALILDRVGLLTPSDIILTRLSIQPLQKHLEEGAKPIIATRQVIIRGESLSSEHISAFTADLQQENFAKELRLSSVERDAQSGLLTFQIDISL